MAAAELAKSDRVRQPAAFEPLDEELLAHPLDFLCTEHYRLRAALAQLEWVAHGHSGEARRKLAGALVRYFREDYSLRIADEYRDFFPLLRRRCIDDAAFRASLDNLAAERCVNHARLAVIVSGLRILAERPQRVDAPIEFAAEARTYIEGQRRHIVWENAVLMPMARRYLNAADLRRLARKLAARRGFALSVLLRHRPGEIETAEEMHD